MQSVMKVALFLAAVLMSMNMAFAEDLIIYPAKGQTPQQMEKDKSECYLWAKDQTGFDPMQALSTTPPPTQVVQQPAQAPQGGIVRGAARGAAVGAVVGSIKGDAGEGAAAGAAAGGMIGGMRRRDQKQQQAATQDQMQQQQQQQEQAQATELEQKKASFNRAYGACLEGRGYTVK
jgi:hypothetical protein